MASRSWYNRSASVNAPRSADASYIRKRSSARSRTTRTVLTSGGVLRINLYYKNKYFRVRTIVEIAVQINVGGIEAPKPRHSEWIHRMNENNFLQSYTVAKEDVPLAIRTELPHLALKTRTSPGATAASPLSIWSAIRDSQAI